MCLEYAGHEMVQTNSSITCNECNEVDHSRAQVRRDTVYTTPPKMQPPSAHLATISALCTHSSTFYSTTCIKFAPTALNNFEVWSSEGIHTEEYSTVMP